ncbi:MAG: hypothetical protein GX539_15860 [Candidatus Cloacimonetes bacterium]|nr:hypothetical protein [Candidatus Cloacimonadota bacterium]
MGEEEIPALALPYPLPEGWRVGDPRRTSWARAIWGGVLALLFAVAAVVVLILDEPGWALALIACAAAAGLAVAILFDRNGGERGRPEFINAVTLTRAMVAPKDSWIHFFRDDEPTTWMSTWFAGVGAAVAALSVWAGVASFGGRGWLLFFALPLLVGALVVLLAGIVALVSIWRHASFGRRPIGLSLGRHGVERYYLDDQSHIAWEDIRAVRASVQAIEDSTGDFSPTVHIDTHAQENALELPIGGYHAHSWLIYTAVRFWAEHPEDREELSRTFGQRRMLGWRATMLEMRSLPPTRA